MIGTLNLVPNFNGAVTSYTATTNNATDVITVTPLKAGATVAIKVNGVAHVNGTAATWLDDENVVEITVTYGTTHKTYAIIVSCNHYNTDLSALTIGSLTLTPEFDAEEISYTATTANATNIITATADDDDATVEIKVNGAAHTSGTAAAWLVGKNTVEITVTYEEITKTYTAVVTKEGTVGALTVASVAGSEIGDTTITVTEQLTTGCKYKYTTDTAVTLPALDDDLSAWTDWDGVSDITAATGNEIVIAEVSTYDNLAKKAGKATVTAKA